MPCSAIIVARVEIRIIVAALELETGLEDFGWYVQRRREEICKKACNRLSVSLSTEYHSDERNRPPVKYAIGGAMPASTIVRLVHS